MTIGDWIEKIVSVFGGQPSAVRRCEKRIADADAKIKLIQEDINRVLEANTALDKQIQEKKRIVERERIQANRVTLQMQITALNEVFNQKTELATFLINQMANLQVLRGKIEISMAQVRTGVSCVALEMQLDEMDDVLEQSEEANKLGRVLATKTVTPVIRVEAEVATHAANATAQSERVSMSATVNNVSAAMDAPELSPECDKAVSQI